MTDLSPEARRLLAHARAGQARAHQALRERVKSQVDAAAVSGKLASAAGVRRARLLPSAGAVMLLGGLAVIVARQPAAHTPQSARLPPPSAVSEVMPPSSPAVVERVQQEVPVVTESATTSSSLPAPADNLRAEMQLLSRAEAALRSDDPQTALQLLRTHAQKFRSGQLREERAGLRLIALCAQGRDPAETLARYLDQHRDSVLHARVSEACARFVP